MKTVKIFLILFLLVSIISRAQLMVQDNGLRQVETTIAIHPTDPGIMAIAAIELLVNTSGRQSVIWVSTNNGTSWTQKKIVSDAADPVIEFDNSGNLFFSYLHKLEFEIYIIKSTNLGTNWSNPLKVSNTNASTTADKEWITVNKLNNKIYLACIEVNSLSRLHLALSTDGGNLFQSQIILQSPVVLNNYSIYFKERFNEFN